MSFGHYLKQQRELNGYSQQDVANHLCVMRKTISNWENGNSYPDSIQLLALWRRCGFSYDEFAQREDSDNILKIAYRTLWIRLSLKVAASFILSIVLYFVGKYLGLYSQEFFTYEYRLERNFIYRISGIISFIVVFFIPKWTIQFFQFLQQKRRIRREQDSKERQ